STVMDLVRDGLGRCPRRRRSTGSISERHGRRGGPSQAGGARARFFNRRLSLALLLALVTACAPDGPREPRPGRGRGPDVRPTSSSSGPMPPAPGVRPPDENRRRSRPPPPPSAPRASGATGGAQTDAPAEVQEPEAARL